MALHWEFTAEKILLVKIPKNFKKFFFFFPYFLQLNRSAFSNSELLMAHFQFVSLQ